MWPGGRPSLSQGTPKTKRLHMSCCYISVLICWLLLHRYGKIHTKCLYARTTTPRVKSWLLSTSVATLSSCELSATDSKEGSWTVPRKAYELATSRRFSGVSPTTKSHNPWTELKPQPQSGLIHFTFGFLLLFGKSERWRSE